MRLSRHPGRILGQGQHMFTYGPRFVFLCSRADSPMLVPVSQPGYPVQVGAAVGMGSVDVGVGDGIAGHTLPLLKKLLGDAGS